ncbi:MAG: tetratricopeptide repeat protein [Nannocystaceae bacterium]
MPYDFKKCEVQTQVSAGRPQRLTQRAAIEATDTDEAGRILAEHLRAGCMEGDHRDCDQHASQLHAGLLVAKDLALAERFRRRAKVLNAYACDCGDEKACASHVDREVPDLARRQLEEAARRCRRGRAGWCQPAGLAYWMGYAGSYDPERALSLLWLACRKGQGLACGTLGIMFKTGEFAAEDRHYAVQYFALGCTFGSVSSCAEVGRAYAHGYGVTADPQQAIAYRRVACEHGHDPSCALLGHLYARGETVEKDVIAARDYWSRACEGGVDTACLMLSLPDVAVTEQIR